MGGGGGGKKCVNAGLPTFAIADPVLTFSHTPAKPEPKPQPVPGAVL